MSDLQLFEGSELPGPAARGDFGGYVYVIEFTTGMVKVGRTNNPRGRIGNHQSDAMIHGHDIARHWLSGHHLNYLANEAELIAYGRRNCSSSMRNEYFAGLQFSKVVEFAKSLAYEEATEEAVTDRESRVEAGFNAMKQAVLKVWGITEDDLKRPPRKAEAPQPRTINDVIGGLFGRQPDGTYRLPAAEVTSQDDLLAGAQRLAALTGDTVDDILRMSWLDVLEESVTMAVRLEALNLEAYAYEHGLLHLVDPMVARDLDEKTPLRLLDGGAS